MTLLASAGFVGEGEAGKCARDKDAEDGEQAGKGQPDQEIERHRADDAMHSHAPRCEHIARDNHAERRRDDDPAAGEEGDIGRRRVEAALEDGQRR